MAVIGKIREKSGLVLIIVGIGMLAFLFQDGATSLFGGSADDSVGEIGDVEITNQDFSIRIEKAIKAWEEQNQQAASTDIRESFREQVWNEIVREKVMDSQIKELGIFVGDDELYDIVTGDDPHPQVKQAFTDPNTQVFNPVKVIEFLKNLSNMPDAQRNQWDLFVESIEKERMGAKYSNLIIKGMYATKSIQKRTYDEQNTKRNIKFVAKRYISVNDSTITVSDEELKAYYEEHKNEYKQDESRDIEYIRFDINPSEADIAESKKWLEDIVEEFKTTEDDSTFVTFYNSYNSTEQFEEPFIGAEAMPVALDSGAFFADSGTVFPVYNENNAFVLAKLSEVKMIPDSVKARHILLKFTQQPSDTLLEAKIDSIKGLVENGADFADLARTFSEDVGSAIEGGDLGWFREGQMVPTFNDACFYGKVGDLTIVPSQYGFHLIDVQAQATKSRKIKLAKVVRPILPSKETADAVFAKASSFYVANTTSEAFTKATEGKEYQKLISAEVKVGDKGFGNMPNVRDIVKWAYNSEKGAIYEPNQFDNTIIVAHLSEVREEGIATMDQVKIQVELGAKKKKKAAMFIEEMKGISNIDELATKVGSTVETANDVNFSAYAIQGMGQELRVSGMISTLKQGDMSVPIEGQTGVFVVQVSSIKTTTSENIDYAPIKAQLQQSYASAASTALEALKEKFGVVDKRYKFY